jgi:hypothetical protein
MSPVPTFPQPPSLSDELLFGHQNPKHWHKFLPGHLKVASNLIQYGS